MHPLQPQVGDIIYVGGEFIQDEGEGWFFCSVEADIVLDNQQTFLFTIMKIIEIAKASTFIETIEAGPARVYYMDIKKLISIDVTRNVV